MIRNIFQRIFNRTGGNDVPSTNDVDNDVDATFAKLSPVRYPNFRIEILDDGKLCKYVVQTRITGGQWSAGTEVDSYQQAVAIIKSLGKYAEEKEVLERLRKEGSIRHIQI